VSTATLARKLGVNAGCQLALVHAPAGFLEVALAPLPDGVEVRRRASADADVTVAFFDERRTLARRLPALAQPLVPGRSLWIAWPKRASGVPTDLSDGVVRELGLATGLVDNKVCAIDEIWSGLRFAPRRGRPPFYAR
jgi:hypothetical protein